MKDAAARLIVALDVPSAAEALHLVDRLDSQIRWFKVGLELYLTAGPTIVTTLHSRGYDVFLDLKLHDIPNTVASAIRAVAPLGPSLLTVHGSGGPAMLDSAQEAAAAFPQLRLLAVTVLTSMDQSQLSATGISGDPAEQVLRLGRLAQASGLPGLVCSAEEITLLRGELDAETLLIVPGIRPQTTSTPSPAQADDQRRIASPSEAIQRGASMLVVGRPITRAQDPAAAAAKILEEIGSLNQA